MPNIYIMKKMWIMSYMAFYLGSGIVSLTIKGITYKFPQLLFKEMLQEYLDKFFLVLPACSFVIYMNSFFLNSLSFIYIE
jgi:hypothetical protein